MGIEVVAFVLEDGGLAQNGKAVGKTTRYEELTVIVFGELYGYMLAIDRAAFADIYCNVQDFTLDATNELALGERRCLEVQATHDAITAHGFVVLHEVDFSHFFFKFSQEESSLGHHQTLWVR